MIGLLGEVIVDIIPFAMVVLYSVLAFSFLTLSSKHPDERTFEFFELFTGTLTAYFDAIGSFEAQTDYSITTLITVFTTIFNCIIMMNLLISILGSTYGRVNDEAQVEDLKQLTEMIIEGESLHFHQRTNKKKTILQICEEYTPPEVVGANDIKQKFRTVKAEIDNLGVKNQKFFDKFEEKNTSLSSKVDSALTNIENAKSYIISELKATIEDLRKQILTSLQKTEEIAQQDERQIYVCLNNHKLNLETVYDRLCDICRKEISDVDALSCTICNFDMCEECATFYYEHSQVKTLLSCHLGHILLHFEDIGTLTQEKEYETAMCRQCGLDFEGSGFHCVVCLYSVCNSCKEIHEASVKKKEICKKQHALKWKHKELYAKKESLSIECSNCKEERLGAGFFSCVECPSYYCLPCFQKDYIKEGIEAKDGEEKGDKDDEDKQNDDEGDEDKQDEDKPNEDDPDDE